MHPRVSAATPAALIPGALVFERDPLMRLLVAPAVAALGLRMLAERDLAAGVAPALVLVPLDGEHECRRAVAEARAVAERRAPAAAGPVAGAPAAGGGVAAASAPPVVAGYGTAPALLAAHRAHGCADLVMRLVAGPAEAGGEPGREAGSAPGGARLVHLPAANAVSAAGLTAREADVLVLLLLGFTTPAAAELLCVSPSTARSHCRAVLRKFGAPDRPALRRRLLGGDPATEVPGGPGALRPRPPAAGVRPRPPRFVQPQPSTSPKNALWRPCDGVPILEERSREAGRRSRPRPFVSSNTGERGGTA